jgi:hypothetical protein
MAPSYLPAFFRNYTAAMVRYARLAQSLDVELFAIGSEMNSLQGYATQWRSVAAAVNQVYAGLTTYMATAVAGYDITWWDAVDLISVSPYYSLSSLPDPSVDAMYYVWMKYYMPRLYNLSAKFHRPLFFNEIGYASVFGTALNPARAWRDDNNAVSQETQAKAYEALLRASQRGSWFRGLVLYHWQAVTKPVVDRMYSFNGKLAECVVAQYWAPKPLTPELATANRIPVACIGTHLPTTAPKVGVEPPRI